MDFFKETGAKLGARTEVVSNRSVTVDGCDGITEYTDELIVLRCGRLKVHIKGRNLRIAIFTDTAAVIKGIIEECKFTY